MHKIKYTLYPNNEIRATHYYSAPRKSVNEDERIEGGDFSCSDSSPSPEAGYSEASVPTLDISAEVSERGESNPRKRTKFGLNAKNTLLRAGGALDTMCQKPHYYVMLTGTLPGGTPEAMQAIADSSHWIVKQIADWLRKTHPSEYWFYVWELQTRGALHIHWCVYLPDTYQRCKLLWNWWDKWHSILQAIQEKTGVDLWRRKDGSYHRRGHSVLQADAQTVYRSVAAYLAGYCASDKNKHAHDASCPYFPSRWWGYSRPLKKLLDSLTETVEVEHTNYRDARYEMQVHYERVLHDSPKAYHYPHKVGIGSTTVSYHPEDKGLTIWQPLNPMLYLPQTHPNTVFLIQTYHRLTQETIYLLEACPKQLDSYSKPLLTMLRGLIFPSTARGYSLRQTDITVIYMIPCELSSPLCIVSAWERLRLSWWHLQDSVKERAQTAKWDRHRYLCVEGDTFGLLDKHPSRRYCSTTEPKGEGDMGGVVNGSLSPQAPPSPEQLCLSLDSSGFQLPQ